MSTKMPLTQFLMKNGATCSKAAAAAQAIENRIAARQSLTDEQSALAIAFLNRPGANPVAEQALAEAARAPRQAATGLATGKRQHKPHAASREGKSATRVWGDPHTDTAANRVSKIDSFTIKQTVVKDSAANAWPAKWKGFSLNGKGNSLSTHEIRTLTDRAGNA